MSAPWQPGDPLFSRWTYARPMFEVLDDHDLRDSARWPVPWPGTEIEDDPLAGFVATAQPRQEAS
jgi:hypothetical protein